MAMHQGFDLSRFKKVSSDEKATTMRHSNGHEVKIVHSALSPKMREQIEALPMHAPEPAKMARGGVVKKMAEGGDPADPEAMDPTSPEPVDDAPPGTDMTAANAANRPAGIPPPPAQAGDVDVGGEPQTSDANTIDVIGHKPAPTMQTLSDEDAAWQQDLRNGHITPQTYGDMFAKKDTLGKIGTLFGLMVGGAGAGLSHQPNAVMAMMDRELQNDLEAQKTSKTNANNFWNTSAHVAQGFANADLIRQQISKNYMQNVVFQHALGLRDKMPPQNQQAADQVLQLMLPQLQAAQARNRALAVLGAHQGGPENAASFTGPVNNEAISALQMVSPEIGGEAATEAGRVFNTRTLFDNYTHAHDRLDSITAGQGSEAVKQAADAVAGFIPMSSLAGSVAELAKNLQQERQAEIQAMPGVPEQFLPSGYDFVPGVGGEKTRAEKANRAAAWFKLQEGPTPRLGLLQKNGMNVITPQPYEAWAGSRKQKAQPKGIGGRSQPLATPEEAAAGNVFPEPAKGKK